MKVILALALITTVFALSPFPFGDQCQCENDEKCCLAGGGHFCCEITSVPSSTCCGGGCCMNQETCCQDDQGASCCIQQTTFCAPKGSGFPARCCPRWTVGCESGSVGCCDPAMPWQWKLAAPSPATVPEKPSQQRKNSTHSLGEGLTAFALFVTGRGLEVVALNATNAEILKRTVVAGLDDNPFGESMRDFLFDPAAKAFYYLDANFTANGGDRPTNGRPAYLYTVDALTGVAHKQQIQGAVDYPTGFSITSNGVLTLATEAWSGTPAAFTGYEFYSLEPSTAIATKLSVLSRGAGETDVAFYAGFHRASSMDGKTVYRFGYQEVSTQTKQGLSVTTVDGGAQAQTTWHDELTPNHDYYMTLDRYDGASSSSFLSLAPRKNDTKRGLDVVQWDISGNTQTIASLDNAHPPDIKFMGDLGYLASHVNGDRFMALVVMKFQEYSSWALAVVGVETRAVDLMPLSPPDIATEWSVSALGFV